MRRIGSLINRLVTTQTKSTITHAVARFSEHAGPQQRKHSRISYLLGGIGLGVAGTYAVQPIADDLKLAWLIPVRLARDVYTAVAIIAGGMSGLWGVMAHGGSEL